jgi:DNA ligase-1
MSNPTDAGARLFDLVRASARVAEVSARRAKTEFLAELLRALAPDEVEIAVSWLAGEPRQGRIGVGYAAVRELRVEPAFAPTLSLREVDAGLGEIAGASGRGSAAQRAQLLGALFARATLDEQRFLVRLLIGELRQGALEGVLTEAIARAASVSPDRVRRAAMLSARLPAVARAALEHGDAGLGEFRLEILRPIQPMLAQTADDPDDALARLGNAALEWKLDGARIQVHRLDDEVRVFSRQQNEVTAAVPEIVELVRALPARALLLDGEAIALRASGAPEAFQTTMRRFGRRLDVERMRAELPLSAFFFDLLHVDGEDLLDRTSDARFAALAERVPEALRVPRLVTSDVSVAHAFLDAALARGHEGIMAKALDAPYEAGRRGAGWLKVKRANTLDLVVLAVEWGSGRRRGLLSNLHLGARDPATGGFVMLGKTFKGMTDEMLAWQTRRFQELEIARDEHTVHVRPEQVVEIAFDGIQASPHYPGGVALRFARVKRYRSDKRAEDADTIDAVRALSGASRPERPPSEGS